MIHYLHPLSELGNISKSWSFYSLGKQFDKTDVKVVCFFFLHSWVCCRDIMADANILQGHIFQDDVAEDECIAASEALHSDSSQKINGEGLRIPLDSKAKQRRDHKPKPAAHRVCCWKKKTYFLYFCIVSTLIIIFSKLTPLNFLNLGILVSC